MDRFTVEIGDVTEAQMIPLYEKIREIVLEAGGECYLRKPGVRAGDGISWDAPEFGGAP